ncbi:MAG TPA: TIGR02588 family protein [Oscillatoriales cyanobacterium M59_W2019_021]|nr:TIGR02588 family protein [Oscillatoriales cyanobacterium M4454_W2019_049]HIK50810.1 TIGR02588 family protein [Oscillatoriales cyanobacterium M59_W2019_021]
MTQISKIRSKSKRKSRTFAEKVTFVFSVLVVSILVSLVLIVWIFKGERPPVLEIARNGEIRAVNGQFYVPFVLTNEGGENVENVQVVGDLEIDGKTEESGEQSMDFLSAGEREEGAFIFHRNPEDGRVMLRVASYKVP